MKLLAMMALGGAVGRNDIGRIESICTQALSVDQRDLMALMVLADASWQLVRRISLQQEKHREFWRPSHGYREYAGSEDDWLAMKRRMKSPMLSGCSGRRDTYLGMSLRARLRPNSAIASDNCSALRRAPIGARYNETRFGSVTSHRFGASAHSSGYLLASRWCWSS